MAKRYTSTIQLQCWKEHTCVCCDSVYSYVMTRKVVGTASTPEKAHAAMQLQASKVVQQQTDMHPCPTCGLYQPDMIGPRRANRQMLVLIIAVVLFGIALIVRGCNGAQSDAISWTLAIIAALTFVFQVVIDFQNVNRDPITNQRIAQERVAAGQIRHTPGRTDARTDEFASPGRSVFHLAAIAMLALSLIPILAPDIIRTSRKWPFNPECYPAVVGPGDQTRIYTRQKIVSVKGYWRGTPQVLLHYPGGPEDGETASATTNQNTWGDTINDVKSEEKNSNSTPYVDLTLPDTPALANKDVNCDIDLKIQFPQMSGSSTFEVSSSEMQTPITIHTAGPGDGARYNSLWWTGSVAGIAMTIFASFILRGVSIRRWKLAKPSKTYALA